jgi:hypothetical protein
LNEPKEEINITMSIKFKKIFYNSIIPYLSPKDLISFKICSKITNSFISKKAIDICIISNSSKNFKSPKQRSSIWKYYLNINNFKSKLFEEDKIKFDCGITDNNNNNNSNNINDNSQYLNYLNVSNNSSNNMFKNDNEEKSIEKEEENGFNNSNYSNVTNNSNEDSDNDDDEYDENDE